MSDVVQEVHGSAASRTEFRAWSRVVHEITLAYRRLGELVRNRGAVSVAPLQVAISRAVAVGIDALQNSPAPIRGYFDDFTTHHSVNVCLLTTRAASLVIKDSRQLQRIALASLLHDVGKFAIAPHIIEKPTRLAADERNELWSHQSRGAGILLGMRDVDPLCVTVMHGHHALGGSVSSPIQNPLESDWITKLVAVADVFETLTAVRPYKRGMSVETAFRAMVQMPMLNQHLPLVKLLYETLGPYPVGTFVELNTGERGVVLMRNESNPSLPTARILTDTAHRPLDAPVDLDLAEEGWVNTTPRRVARPIVQHARDEDPLEMTFQPDPDHILGSPLHDGARLMQREG